jgi:OOP family OmpA-OmpF porin
MPWSSNATFLTTLRCEGPDGPIEQRAIYKPVRGERPLWDFEPGLHKRERAAYLRDPLARDPAALVPESLPADRIVGSWSSYMALDAEMVERRAARYLLAPENVTLIYSGDTLFAQGAAHPLWIQKTRERIAFIPGFSTFDDRGLRSRDNDLLDDTVARIEQFIFFFSPGDAFLYEAQRPVVDSLASTLRTLLNVGEEEGLLFRIRVYGYASSEGSEALNRILSQQRASYIRDELVQRGIPADRLVPVGTGRVRIGETEFSATVRAANRSVSFGIVL